MKKIVLIIAFCIAGSFAFADTLVSGGIFSDVTWTKAKSPYIITSNLVVLDDVTLTIEPGVTIKFQKDVMLLLSNSKIVAEGTKTDSIIFTSTVPIPGYWSGIAAAGTNAQKYSGNQVTLRYVKGMYANLFLNSGDNIRLHSLRNSTFSYNNTALKGNTNTVIDSCLLYKNKIGVTGTSTREYKFLNCIFDGNEKGAEELRYVENTKFINHTVYALYPYGITNGCYFENNKIAVYSPFYNSENNTFTNNTVINNETGVQMGTYFNGSITFTGNTICNNKLYNLERLEGGNAADLAGNCWCTTNLNMIESKIKDAKDDISLALVTISPTDAGSNCALITSLSETEAGVAAIEVSPVPAADFIKVTGLITGHQLSFLDQTGTLVKLVDISANENIISVSGLQPGFYAILIDGKYLRKFLKL